MRVRCRSLPQIEDSSAELAFGSVIQIEGLQVGDSAACYAAPREALNFSLQ